MNKRNIYVVGWSTDYANWMQGRIVDKIENADLVVMTGGEDVCPEFYNKQAHPTTYFNRARDVYELEMFDIAISLKKPVIGICRGAQLSCVKAGGILVQDQAPQGHIHMMDTFDGKRIVVTSSHHQAQYPWGLPKDEYRVLGWTNGLSAYHYGESDNDEMVVSKAPNQREVEVCYYPKINALGWQGHPEWLYHDYEQHPKARESIDYCRSLLDRFLAKEL